MRGSMVWLLPLVGCGSRLLVIDYPTVEGVREASEILAIEHDGQTSAYAMELGTPWRIPEIFEDQDASMTALIYPGSLEDNGLQAGPIEPLENAPALPVDHLGAFSMQIDGGEARGWRPLDELDPALARYQIAARPVVDIASGISDRNTCLIYDDRSTRCFGDNTLGQLGRAGDGVSRPDPPMFTGIRQITTGSHHTCALSEDGRVLCFGKGGLGQLGRATLVNVDPIPDFVPGLDGITQIEGGREWTCALDTLGQVACFGFTSNHDLRGRVLAPIPFPAPIEKIGVSSFSVCGLAGGRLYCHGVSVCHVLTVPNDSFYGDREVHFGEPVKDLGGGDTTFCALLESGALYCWGCNGIGQAVPDRPDGRSVSVPALVREGVASFELGGDVSCALEESGDAICWGGDSAGQIGDGPNDSTMTLPQRVRGLMDVVEIEVFDNHGCARTSTGEVRCWGQGVWGQLGNGELEDQSSPVSVARVR